MEHFVRRFLFGSVAGVIATLPMSAFMLAARRAGLLTEQAPERITELSIERSIHNEVKGRTLDAATALTHLAFGAVAGALYAVSLGRWRGESLPPGLVGAVYGTLVWLISYWGVLPALGLMPSPPRDERQRPLVMLTAHWIYGGALEFLSPRPRQRSPIALEPERRSA